MSLLDIEETTNELNELEYMTYSKFTEYLEKHVPRDLWDHHGPADYPNYNAMREVSYIKFIPVIRTTKHECDDWGPIDPLWGGVVSERHMCIHITPTDDDLVNLEYPKYYASLTFPILVHGNEKIPSGVLKVLDPIKDKIQIIEGCL